MKGRYAYAFEFYFSHVYEILNRLQFKDRLLLENHLHFAILN